MGCRICEKAEGDRGIRHIPNSAHIDYALYKAIQNWNGRAGMARTVGIGHQNFERLITRPRRFLFDEFTAI